MTKRLTLLYNDTEDQYKEFVSMIEQIGIDYRMVPTSGCDTLWIRNDEGTIIDTCNGPTAVRRFLTSQLEQDVKKVA